MLISLIRPYFRDKGETKDDQFTSKDFYHLTMHISLIISFSRDEGVTKDDNLPSKDT